VVDAAVAAGVGHLVYTSVLRAGSTQLAIAPEHKATERACTDNHDLGRLTRREPTSSSTERTSQMQHVNQEGTTRRTMLRAGAAGTAAALGAAGIFATGTASAATTAGRRTKGLPYLSGVTDTSHCTPGAAAAVKTESSRRDDKRGCNLRGLLNSAVCCSAVPAP
jgi:hypothetical protein